MAESSHDNNRPTPSKVRPRNSAACGGEIVAVQGGHIVRSTGRKDRHSKVCTAKGTRDRRVRLAAHTAIQFYDVQDRLGFDRPSKAVDWLIMKAQSAIDDLAQLPPWLPPAVSGQNPSFRQEEEAEQNNDSNPTAQSSTFFPAGASRNNTNDPDNNQDLRLSLHSFQDPIFLHHHSPASSRPPGFDRWPEHQQHPMELSRIQPWNGGYMFNPPPPVLGQNRFLSQRESLQSSNTPSVRAWIPMDHHYQSSFSGGFSEFQSDQVERYGYADNKPSFDSSH